jgi:hypothetical protein
MNKAKIIIFSILIILIFALLFLVNKPNHAPNSEVNEELFTEFKGRKGFTVITLPNFLIKQILEKDDSSPLELKTSSNQKLTLMMFHDKKTQYLQQDSVTHKLFRFLDEKSFQALNSYEREYGKKYLYSKPHENNWRESVIVFESDSSLFVFNLINKLSTKEIESIAATLEQERTSFE